ncbi:MAG: DegV family protein [Lachnospiraceae bacterium]|nr:DegV family protein [Lachnospiraceae bacterium]
MRPVKILTDSCSDLNKELRDKYDIDYVFMNTEFEGKETPASLDWAYISAHDFYETMRNGGRFLTTQVPISEFKRAYSEYLEKGFDVVYIGCSSKQSGSVNTGFVVAREFMNEHPEMQIFVIDSLNACMGEGLLAMKAAEYRNQGLDAKTINEKITAELKTVNEFCTIHTLEYMKRAGRIKASKAFFGNLLGVKPIIVADAEGNQTALKKAKGRQNSMQEIVNLMKEAVGEDKDQTIYVLHADCLEEAKELEKMVQEEIGPRDTYVTHIGPIIGASIGPDALALFAFGKTVTFVG